MAVLESRKHFELIRDRLYRADGVWHEDEARYTVLSSIQHDWMLWCECYNFCVLECGLEESSKISYLLDRISTLEHELRDAGNTFRRYSELHFENGSYEKAISNLALADKCYALGVDSLKV
jgi:hypothetical protein